MRSKNRKRINSFVSVLFITLLSVQIAVGEELSSILDSRTSSHSGNVENSSPDVYESVRKPRGIVKTTCQNITTGFSKAEGIIHSPNFPSNYGNNALCSWTIQVESGYRINISFTNFTLEPSSNCLHDSLEIYDGPSDSGPRLGKFCGTELPGNIQISGNKSLIRFKSDGTIVFKGFRLHYKMICEREYKDTRGHLSSPYYPGKYPPNLNCVYRIEVSTGYQVNLTIHVSEIEKQINCSYDYLQVRDGFYGSSREMAKLCGVNATWRIISTHNSLWMKFWTDDTVVKKGFRAEYEAVKLECMNDERDEYIVTGGNKMYICGDSSQDNDTEDRSCGKNHSCLFVKENETYTYAEHHVEQYGECKILLVILWSILSGVILLLMVFFAVCFVRSKERIFPYRLQPESTSSIENICKNGDEIQETNM